MRLFVAVPLPETALVEAGAILAGFRSLEWPVRWVRPDGLHITLKFFGEVASERLDTITEMVGFAVAGLPALRLSLASVGAFPNLTHPRVIRLDLAGQTSGLELLQDRIERGGLGIGFPPEGRPFHPHITLGRVKEGLRLPREAGAIMRQVATGSEFAANKVVVYESHQTPSGPAYDPRVQLPLVP
jgi:2'-5' RNA ligase